MKRALSLVVLLVISSLVAVAHAQTATAVINLTFTVDTKYVDGSAMPASELVGQRVAWGTCTGSAFTKLGEHKLAGTARADSITITGVTLPATYCVTVFTTAQKAGADPVESAGSNFASITFPKPTTPTPGAPTVINANCTYNGQVWTCTISMQ